MPDATTQSTAGLISLGTSSPSALTTSSIPSLSTSDIPALASAPAMTAASYAPEQRNIDAEKETVQGQFNGLLTSGSPLVKMARTSADQQMNARGLLNSSIASRASDMAAYQAALPIAQADANIYGNAAQSNVNATNTALASGAQASNDASKLNLTAQLDALKTNMDASLKTHLAGIEADYKTLIQTSASASEIYKGSLTAINSVLQDETMDAAAKASAVNAHISNMKGAMNLVASINGVQLSGTDPDGTTWDLLNFDEAEAP